MLLKLKTLLTLLCLLTMVAGCEGERDPNNSPAEGSANNAHSFDGTYENINVDGFIGSVSAVGRAFDVADYWVFNPSVPMTSSATLKLAGNIDFHGLCLDIKISDQQGHQASVTQLCKSPISLQISNYGGTQVSVEVKGVFQIETVAGVTTSNAMSCFIGSCVTNYDFAVIRE